MARLPARQGGGQGGLRPVGRATALVKRKRPEIAGGRGPEWPAGGRIAGIQGQGCRRDGWFRGGYTRNTWVMLPIRHPPTILHLERRQILSGYLQVFAPVLPLHFREQHSSSVLQDTPMSEHEGVEEQAGLPAQSLSLQSTCPSQSSSTPLAQFSAVGTQVPQSSAQLEPSSPGSQ
jgi:hypothetical protein